MRLVALAVSVFAALAAAVPLAFADASLEHSAGIVLAVRSYVTGVMDYCADNVAPLGEFSDAVEGWRQRNSDDSAALDTVLADIDVDAATAAQMKQMVSRQISSDAADAGDTSAFCEKTAGQIASGQRDMNAMAPEAMAAVRAAAGH